MFLRRSNISSALSLRDVLAEQLDAARGRPMQAEQVAQERALARTAAAHDDHDLALPRR
jgi:hypothetical protein